MQEFPRSQSDNFFVLKGGYSAEYMNEQIFAASPITCWKLMENSFDYKVLSTPMRFPLQMISNQHF